MYFSGQPELMRQLGMYLPYLLENESASMNFMFQAPSGWGKTRLALLCANYLRPEGDFFFAVPKDGLVEVDTAFRVIFIDEIHTLLTPEELYPHMDSGEHIFMFASNDTGNLREALINRCVPMQFAPYSMEDLRWIAKGQFKWPVGDNELNKIVVAGAENPRIIINLARRLSIYVSTHGLPEDLDVVLHDTFGIVDGIDATGRRYLDLLTELGGRASLDTLSSGLHTSKSVLLYQVEPILLQRKRIQISGKGRVLCQ